MAEARRLGKTELLTHFAERLGIQRMDAREFFDELQQLAEQELLRCGEFVLPGIVKLVVQKRERRVGRNPATGAPVEIPAKQVVKARCGAIIPTVFRGAIVRTSVATAAGPANGDPSEYVDVLLSDAGKKRAAQRALKNAWQLAHRPARPRRQRPESGTSGQGRSRALRSRRSCAPRRSVMWWRNSNARACSGFSKSWFCGRTQPTRRY